MGLKRGLKKGMKKGPKKVPNNVNAIEFSSEAPAPATTTDPEAGMFDCYYCGVEDPCDQPFVENFVGRMNKTSECLCSPRGVGE